MFLSELISVLPSKEVSGNRGVEIERIAYHSKDVEGGFLFFALRGVKFDGHNFVAEAFKRGAKAVVVERFVKDLPGLTQIKVPDTRRALGILSSTFYGNPSERLRLIGVTGTNGKTTTTFLLESVLKEAERRVGVLGTINYRFSGRTFKRANTTPESLDLQVLLRDMVDGGVEDCVMEVSSHALTMKRVMGCFFEGGIFTNLSQDHLDFHGDMDSYFRSKATFFNEILESTPSKDPFSVVNIDDPRGGEILPDNGRILRFGRNRGADIRPIKIIFSKDGIRGTLQTPEGRVEISSHLIGDFNLYNIMAAVGAGVALGLPTDIIEKGIESLKGVRGRMERVYSGEGFDVIVDYAHTGDALKRVLISLKTFTAQRDDVVAGKGRLITVFGCGGDRDRGKRPIMGKVSAEESDITILTSDNPRGERPYKIIEDIERGLKEAGLKRLNGLKDVKRGYLIKPDRREAISLAVEMAQVGDTVLIAGKGHEDYQIVGNDILPFDDHLEVERALEKRGLQ